MRRAGWIVSAAVVLAAVTACGGSGGDGEDYGETWGARTCSDWAGRMSADERWDAAEALLVSSKAGDDGTEGSAAPDTSTVRQFETDLGTMCEQEPADRLLGQLSGELYQSNPSLYEL